MSSIFDQYSNIQVVQNCTELFNTSFTQAVNAICWQRELHGNFNEIVAQLELIDDVTEVSVADLMALQLSKDAQLAREIILEDINTLTEFGAAPSLNLIKHYARDEELDFISTDVYSYHVDRSPIASDTFLCTYHGTASDILPNAQAQQKILSPEIRTQLKALYDGPETEFEQFLTEYYFDLHYQATSDAHPINLGLGHLWKLAVDHPEQTTLPCIHRAPQENAGEYRLLLIC